jgi:hypothetical protein
MSETIHRLRYDHGDGRAGTLCGIELVSKDGVYTSLRASRKTLIAKDPGEETCGRCRISGPNRRAWRPKP